MAALHIRNKWVGLFVFILSALPAHAYGMEGLFKEYGDWMRTLQDFENPLENPMLDDPALTSVTREFGPSVIRTQQLPSRSGIMVSKIKPWSSWWFPKREQFLFLEQGGGRVTSPLGKYDLYRKVRSRSGWNAQGSAAEYERNRYNPETLAWEGLCDAWSLASISFPEPKRPVTLILATQTVTFGIADLKALLLKTFEAVEDSGLRYYGQKFTGDFNGWIYPDLFPEQFHRFLEIQLGEKAQPFLMDHDSGVEVWTVPVYKANFTIQSVENDPDAVAVQTWLYSAESSPENQKDFVGTRELVREYNYVLRGKRDANGDLVVQYGYWTKSAGGIDSRKDHPDFLIALPDPTQGPRLIRKSWNPEIDIQVVDEILSMSL